MHTSTTLTNSPTKSPIVPPHPLETSTTPTNTTTTSQIANASTLLYNVQLFFLHYNAITIFTSLTMADLKLTPFKKNTPTKSPKTTTSNKKITPKRESNTTYITPTKKMKTSVHQPSPSKNLDKMCKILKQENTKLKNEITEMFRRLSLAGNVQQIGDMLLDNVPLLTLYELFMEVKLDATNKDQEGTSSYIPLLIPDSSASDV